MAPNIIPSSEVSEVVGAPKVSLQQNTIPSTTSPRENGIAEPEQQPISGSESAENGARSTEETRKSSSPTIASTSSGDEESSGKIVEQSSEAAMKELVNGVTSKSANAIAERSTSVHGQSNVNANTALTDSVSSRPPTLLNGGLCDANTKSVLNSDPNGSCNFTDNNQDWKNGDVNFYDYLYREAVYYSLYGGSKRDLGFVDRVRELPIVSRSVRVYKRAKRSNILSLPLTLMEFGAAVSAFPFLVVASPFLYSCNEPGTVTNWVLCKGLDAAEAVFPCITAPPYLMCRVMKDSTLDSLCCCPRAVKRGVFAMCQKTKPA